MVYEITQTKKMGSSKSKKQKQLKEALNVKTFNHYVHFNYLINVNVPKLDYNKIKEVLRRKDFSSSERKKIDEALFYILNSKEVELRKEVDEIHSILFEKDSLPLLAIRNVNLEVIENTFKVIICDISKF
jgi:hypothetical protein